MIRISDKLQLIGSSYLSQVIRILTLFVMARLIGPNDNGIYMLVIYVAGLVMALSDFAIPQSVVQIRDHDEDVVVDTGLVLIVLLYAFYGLFAVAAGIFLTLKDPHHDPHYWRIGVMVAISAELAGLYNVQLARLNRRLNFRAESRQNIIFAVSTAATGIFFALLHYGSYALALQILAGQLAANIAINFRVPLSWPRHASWTVAKRFFTLGTPASLATYVRTVESSIVGLIIKSIPLPNGGIYGIGLWSKVVQVQGLFGQNLLTSFQRVAYPLICHSVSDPPRMRQLFARTTLIIMMVSMLFTGSSCSQQRGDRAGCSGSNVDGSGAAAAHHRLGNSRGSARHDRQHHVHGTGDHQVVHEISDTQPGSVYSSSPVGTALWGRADQSCGLLERFTIFAGASDAASGDAAARNGPAQRLEAPLRIDRIGGGVGGGDDRRTRVGLACSPSHPTGGCRRSRCHRLHGAGLVAGAHDRPRRAENGSRRRGAVTEDEMPGTKTEI